MILWRPPVGTFWNLLIGALAACCIFAIAIHPFSRNATYGTLLLSFLFLALLIAIYALGRHLRRNLWGMVIRDCRAINESAVERRILRALEGTEFLIERPTYRRRSPRVDAPYERLIGIPEDGMMITVIVWGPGDCSVGVGPATLFNRRKVERLQAVVDGALG